VAHERNDPAGGESAFTFLASDPKNPTAADAIGAFREPRTPSDEIPRHSLNAPEGLFPLFEDAKDSWRPGNMLLHSSRLIGRELGKSDAKYYALPTSSGWVCQLLTGVGSACDANLTNGLTMHAGRAEEDGPLVVYGLVEDHVDRVVFVIRGSAYPATMLRSGYFLEVDDQGVRADMIEEVRTHSAGNRVAVLPIL
jgi:hypothetical protein